MTIKLKHVKLHSPLFFGGKSFTTDLFPARTADISLEYDPETQMVYVEWRPNNKHHETAMVPLSNVASMVEAKEPIKAEKPQHTTQPIAGGPEKVVAAAQVETPYGHVHAGPGHGKTK